MRSLASDSHVAAMFRSTPEAFVEAAIANARLRGDLTIATDPNALRAHA
jgi:hypothetical protein